MKITDVKATIVFGRSIFVQVFTDEGVTGIGECSPMNAQVLAHFVNTVLRRSASTRTRWRSTSCGRPYRPYKLGVMGAHLEAIAGVDIALWDILGKVTGQPAGILLGGCYRDKVRMYASLGAGRSARRRSKPGWWPTTWKRLHGDQDPHGLGLPGGRRPG